jgi:hypothetical protein
MPQRAVLGILATLAALALGACGGDDGDGGDPPLFPADYATTYQQVRNCRNSIEHPGRIRVLAAPDALAPYRGRSGPFPVGAVVLKEVYSSIDSSCAAEIDNFAVMVKLEPGSSPDTLDWSWQEVSFDRKKTATDVPRCTTCHARCGVPAEGGYDATCTHP